MFSIIFLTNNFISLIKVAGKTGVQTQLIVQSKGVPSTMTMQQLQTMMKQQNIQNVSVSIYS